MASLQDKLMAQMSQNKAAMKKTCDAQDEAVRAKQEAEAHGGVPPDKRHC